jgi:hypothetical protein
MKGLIGGSVLVAVFFGIMTEVIYPKLGFGEAGHTSVVIGAIMGLVFFLNNRR